MVVRIVAHLVSAITDCVEVWFDRNGGRSYVWHWAMDSNRIVVVPEVKLKA